MQINVKHRKAQVSVEHKTVNRMDPTDMVTIEIVRNDGFQFNIIWFFDWMIRCPQSPHLDENGVRDKELKDILKRHNLPSLQWIEKQYESEMYEPECNDPMGPVSNYI